MSILPLALQLPKLSDEVPALAQRQLASASKFEGSLPMSIREAFAWNYPIHRDRNCSSYTHTLYVVSIRPLPRNPTLVYVLSILTLSLRSCPAIREYS